MAATPNARSVAERFGYGLREDELDRIGNNPKYWLLNQIKPRNANKALDINPPSGGLSTKAAVAVWRDLSHKTPSNTRRGQDRTRDAFNAEKLDRLRRRVASDVPFVERWVAFFDNHLALAARKNSRVRCLVGAYEREVIRANAFGRYEDMVIASAKHPAMLYYLDAFRSIRPRTKGGYTKGGINENYARELLELHTVGSGYGMPDIQALAKILTGWTLENDGMLLPLFAYKAELHIDGAQTVMGKRFKPDGVRQGEAAIRYLCRHPRTAERMAKKIAAHFTQDDPPGNLVRALKERWRKSGGNLYAVARELASHEEALGNWPEKFKTPHDLLVSLLRVTGRTPNNRELSQLNTFGQHLWDPISPKGFPDTAMAWVGPQALMDRIDLPRRVGLLTQNPLDAWKLADRVYGKGIDPTLKAAMQAADNPRERLNVLLGSPNFQWRR